MAREGRIVGRISDDRTAYELVQFDTVRESIPLVQAHADDRLKRAIANNKWEPLA